VADLDLRAFLRRLEAAGELHRIKVEVDPVEEITIIQHRVLARSGPALLFERVKGSPYPLVSNLFGTRGRVAMAFGRPPAEIGGTLAGLAERLMPPTLAALWSERRALRGILHARLRDVAAGPILESIVEPPDLTRLPCLTCWPLDGGPFFTLPLVQTHDPVTGIGNLGIYRLQRFDATSTGLHWQIEKGGGFHFARSRELGRPLPISVILGGPPALTLAAIAPMPEGIDERLLAAYIMGSPLDVIRRESGHRIPAAAEFVIEGTVTPGDLRREGPFGDHLGHYSHSADFPVFRAKRLLSRRDAIYPATVVGKPPQEDYFIGEALQEMSIPLLKIVKPGIRDLWAYPETGFHPLAVLAVRERYEHEALKHAFGVLGEGQLSLTKVLIVVDEDVDVRDFRAVSRALRRHFDPATGLHLISPTAQDTLDFTGPAMNVGSRLILLAVRRDGREVRPVPPPSPAPGDVHEMIRSIGALGEGVLAVRVSAGAMGMTPAAAPGATACAVPSDAAHRIASLREALARHPAARQYPLQVLLSEDVPPDDPRLLLWGWFTRFDPHADLHPAGRVIRGNRLIFDAPVLFDATWKQGYRQPVAFDPEKEAAVERRWPKFGLPE
jgi:UbiD family decarboxylase